MNPKIRTYTYREARNLASWYTAKFAAYVKERVPEHLRDLTPSWSFVERTTMASRSTIAAHQQHRLWSQVNPLHKAYPEPAAGFDLAKCYARVEDCLREESLRRNYHQEAEREREQVLALHRSLPALPGYKIDLARSGTGGGRVDVHIQAPELTEDQLFALVAALPRREST